MYPCNQYASQNRSTYHPEVNGSGAHDERLCGSELKISPNAAGSRGSGMLAETQNAWAEGCPNGRVFTLKLHRRHELQFETRSVKGAQTFLVPVQTGGGEPTFGQSRRSLVRILPQQMEKAGLILLC